jgi:hypothetical protein
MHQQQSYSQDRDAVEAFWKIFGSAGLAAWKTIKITGIRQGHFSVILTISPSGHSLKSAGEPVSAWNPTL